MKLSTQVSRLFWRYRNNLAGWEINSNFTHPVSHPWIIRCSSRQQVRFQGACVGSVCKFGLAVGALHPELHRTPGQRHRIWQICGGHCAYLAQPDILACSRTNHAWQYVGVGASWSCCAMILRRFRQTPVVLTIFAGAR